MPGTEKAFGLHFLCIVSQQGEGGVKLIADLGEANVYQAQGACAPSPSLRLRAHQVFRHLGSDSQGLERGVDQQTKPQRKNHGENDAGEKQVLTGKGQ